ncbi:uncharacterized protein LOC130689981 [Daphnia carinata]|uniref:uncharacterized protein LOC130689981 n=1 Tax=Daphnia carinata TaxID=120202 RepID=UPI00257DB2A5|nr:uncharacterized protein LOC130689981 [Daphnia carinata]
MCWLHLFKAVTSNSISAYISQRCSAENSQSDFESSTNMKTSLAILILSAVVAAVIADGEYAPPALEKKYEGYFQYANVPAKDEYEFGHNRGNPSHNRNQYEQSKDHRFRTKVKWSDAYGGYGEHNWEYNHADSAYKGNGYPAPAYPAPAQDYSAPGYSAPYPTYEEAPAAKV